MTAIILDTETTGVSDPHATQIAWLSVGFESELVRKGQAFYSNFNPLKPISYGSMATTGICEEDIKDCPPHTDFELPDGLEYIIGHNIDYDCNVLANAGCYLSGVKRICTLALSRKYYPDTDSHQLGAMLYLLDYATARKFAKNAHDAAHDVIFTFSVLERICDDFAITSIEQLYALSEQARIPDIISFGKYKGMAIKDLPGDYVGWLLKQDNVDPYLRKALTA